MPAVTNMVNHHHPRIRKNKDGNEKKRKKPCQRFFHNDQCKISKKNKDHDEIATFVL